MNQIRTDRREITILSISHLITDINQGAVPALLPFLVMQRGMSYLGASGVVMAATLVSSILQPILGHSSDRKPMPWLMPLGLLAAGLGISLVGITSSYWAIIACILLTGTGVATFHPEAYRFANYVSGENKGTGISLFSVGGNGGFAFGPIIITSLILTFGLRGTLFMVISTTIMAFIIWRELPRLVKFRPTQNTEMINAANRKSMWPAFIRLVVMIVLRSSLYFGLISFAPLYLIKIRGASIAEANATLTMMAVLAAGGTLIGGYMADRYGRKAVLTITLGILPLLLAGFLFNTGLISSICLGLTGFFMASSSSVSIVLGQEYIPNNIGVASGITTGLAIGLGGVSSPIFGSVADHFGITTVFYIFIILPFLASLVASSLPPVVRELPTDINQIQSI